jgi:hypothetical protein
MFTYQIVATEAFTDESDSIAPGHILIEGDKTEAFQFSSDALMTGLAVLQGISGGRAFNAARDSADIIAAEVE